MNTRIKLHSDKTAVVQPSADGESVTLLAVAGGLHVPESHWDLEGLAALTEVAHCLMRTGDLSALSDASRVPYVGKRMWCDPMQRHVTVIYIGVDSVTVVTGDGHVSNQLPAPPSPVDSR